MSPRGNVLPGRDLLSLQPGADRVRAAGQAERPELEQYELAIEEQAFPFEEKAIATHQKNIELLSVGVGSLWIERISTSWRSWCQRAMPSRKNDRLYQFDRPFRPDYIAGESSHDEVCPACLAALVASGCGLQDQRR